MQKRKTKPVYVYTYTKLDELMASTTAPISKASRMHQLTRMWAGLANIETADEPTTDDWRVCSDAVNLMETLVALGVVQDENKLLSDAVTALAMAGRRHAHHGKIRLDAQGIQAVRAVLEDYATMLDMLPARTMIKCYRATEQRIHGIMAGRSLPHDVRLVTV